MWPLRISHRELTSMCSDSGLSISFVSIMSLKSDRSEDSRRPL